MARTDADAVKAVLAGGKDYDLEENPSLDPYIAAASAIVDRVATCATNRGKALSGAELELVERWLAAHAYAMSDQTYASRSTAGASGNFHGQTGMYLEATKYGQMALNLDYSGCLAAITKRKSMNVSWLGKSVPEQISYDDRN